VENVFIELTGDPEQARPARRTRASTRCSAIRGKMLSDAPGKPRLISNGCSL
jgi:hypothetical protein